MLSLDDFLEMLEELPQEVHDRFMHIKNLDAQVQSAMRRNKEAVDHFFAIGGTLSEQERNERFQALKLEYARIRALADEKVAIAERIQDLMNKYAHHLEKEKTHFQLELEADNPGVTEAIEKRYSDYVDAMVAMRKERKKRHQSNGVIDPKDVPALLNGFAELGKESSERIQKILHNATSSRTSRTDLIDDSLMSSSALVPTTPPVAPNPRGRPPKSSLMLSSALAADDVISNTPTASRRRSNAVRGNASTSSFGLPATSGMASSSRMSPAASDKSWSTTGVDDSPTSNVTSFSLGTPSSSLGMPNFVGSESRHGRPRKLTTKVQEMFKEAVQRQRHHQHHSPLLSATSSSASLTQTPSSSQNSGQHLPPMRHDDDDDDESGEDDDDGEDTRRPWCFCNEKSYGAMIECDNKACPYQWFHYPCVDMTAPPVGRWFCPHCTRSGLDVPTLVDGGSAVPATTSMPKPTMPSIPSKTSPVISSGALCAE